MSALVPDPAAVVIALMGTGVIAWLYCMLTDNRTENDEDWF